MSFNNTIANSASSPFDTVYTPQSQNSTGFTSRQNNSFGNQQQNNAPQNNEFGCDGYSGAPLTHGFGSALSGTTDSPFGVATWAFGQPGRNMSHQQQQQPSGFEDTANAHVRTGMSYKQQPQQQPLVFRGGHAFGQPGMSMGQQQQQHLPIFGGGHAFGQPGLSMGQQQQHQSSGFGGGHAFGQPGMSMGQQQQHQSSGSAEPTFHGAFAAVSHIGTGNPSYRMTEDPERWILTSICHMPEYQNKSPEELRYEDYLKKSDPAAAIALAGKLTNANAFGSANAYFPFGASAATSAYSFGAPASTPTAFGATTNSGTSAAFASSGVFGAPAANAFGSIPGAPLSFGRPGVFRVSTPASASFSASGSRIEATTGAFGSASASNTFDAAPTAFGSPDPTNLSQANYESPLNASTTLFTSPPRNISFPYNFTLRRDAERRGEARALFREPRALATIARLRRVRATRVRKLNMQLLHSFNAHPGDDTCPAKDVTECSICLDEVVEGDKMVLLPCHATHLYHHDCIEKWLLRKPTCPMCVTRMDHIITNQVRRSR